MNDDIKFVHTGLAASSEENADRFFIDILGLEKSEPKIIDKKLTHALFGINDELLMIHYRGGNVDYEIFVYKEYKAPEKQIAHSCIKVNDLKIIAGKCKDAGLKVIEVPKGSGVITFISDYDGNLFEVKK
jgi:catechol 2,3-dioxygenase-like lactoylglutathione lyase family enzyme